MSTQRSNPMPWFRKRFAERGITHTSSLDQRRSGSSNPSVLVTHIEPEVPDWNAVLKMAGRLWGARPIVVTTDARVRLLLGRGIAFEHLPARDQIATHRDFGDWETYVHQRWRMIHSKWSPLYTIHVGITYNQFIEGIRDELRR